VVVVFQFLKVSHCVGNFANTGSVNVCPTHDNKSEPSE